MTTALLIAAVVYLYVGFARSIYCSVSKQRKGRSISAFGWTVIAAAPAMWVLFAVLAAMEEPEGDDA